MIGLIVLIVFVICSIMLIKEFKKKQLKMEIEMEKIIGNEIEYKAIKWLKKNEDDITIISHDITKEKITVLYKKNNEILEKVFE